MTTATPRKTSLENKPLRSCDYFMTTSSCLNSTMLAKYATTGLQLQGAPLKSKYKELQISLGGVSGKPE